MRESGLDVQVRHVQCVLPDEVPPWLDYITHQFGEDVVGFVELGDFYAEQRAHVGIECGFPELLGIHFAKALVALHGNAFAASGEDGFQQIQWAMDHRV